MWGELESKGRTNTITHIVRKCVHMLLKGGKKLGMVVHVHKPSTWEIDAGGFT